MVNPTRKRAARLVIFVKRADPTPIIRGSTYRQYCGFEQSVTAERSTTSCLPRSRPPSFWHLGHRHKSVGNSSVSQSIWVTAIQE